MKNSYLLLGGLTLAALTGFFLANRRAFASSIPPIVNTPVVQPPIDPPIVQPFPVIAPPVDPPIVQPPVVIQPVIVSPVIRQSFRPAQCSKVVDDTVHAASARYNLPRWFYYAICQRETSFNASEFNPNGGYGLTQLTGLWYAGRPYPYDLQTPKNQDTRWRDDMGLNVYGPWIDMSNVSILVDPFDPLQNLARFSTGYAVPAYYLFGRLSGLSPTSTLRLLAFHWRYGIFKTYNPGDTGYLLGTWGYDKWVSDFKGPCDADDGEWDGAPRL